MKTLRFFHQTPPEARNCQSSTSQEALLLGGKKNSPFRKIFDHSLQKMCTTCKTEVVDDEFLGIADLNEAQT
ncbi:hypothetical protein O3P69_020316 [Scylla paramamosain]|uniref:Uncharacterized protein n=1 Tax=Scylla paramamosain TaxID=85552 RepID=A0AAW0SKH2_SCYPA